MKRNLHRCLNISSFLHISWKNNGEKNGGFHYFCLQLNIWIEKNGYTSIGGQGFSGVRLLYINIFQYSSKIASKTIKISVWTV